MLENEWKWIEANAFYLNNWNIYSTVYDIKLQTTIEYIQQKYATQFYNADNASFKAIYRVVCTGAVDWFLKMLN